MTIACNRSGSTSNYSKYLFLFENSYDKAPTGFPLMLHVIVACPALPQLSVNPNLEKSRRFLPCLSCEILVKLSCTLLLSLTTLKARKTHGDRSTEAAGTVPLQSSSSTFNVNSWGMTTKTLLSCYRIGNLAKLVPVATWLLVSKKVTFRPMKPLLQFQTSSQRSSLMPVGLMLANTNARSSRSSSESAIW